MTDGGPLLPDELASVARTKHLLDGTEVASRSRLNWKFGSGLVASITDDPENNQAVAFIDAPGNSKTTGEVNVGAGTSSAGSGYSLSATTWTAVDLTQDLVIPITAGTEVDFQFDGLVTSGTGSVQFDILSVNNTTAGTYVGDAGVGGNGWPSALVPASQTKYPKSWRAWYVVTADDIVNGTATFRLMYRLSAAGGSPVLIKNDVDGHFRFRAWPASVVSIVAGQSTQPPSSTPPGSGTVTDRGTTQVALTSSATRTLSSGSFTPTAGHVLVAVAQTWVSNKTTQALTIADTFADGAGSTAWTSRLDQQSTIGTGSGGLKMWTRTVGAAPSAGTITTTRDVATSNWNETLVILELTGWTEAPTQSGGQTTGNVSSVTLNLTTPGSTDMVVTSLFNLSAAVPVSAAPTIPTTGTGTWVSDDDAIRNDDGHATAYQIGGVASSLNWTGLSPTSGQPIPAGYLVFTPSGSATAAPGTDSFTHADQNPWTGNNTDMTPYSLSGGLNWQLKSNALTLASTGSASSAFATAPYDVGSSDMQCDFVVDQFPLPTGASTNVDALSAYVRANNSVPLSCYMGSWNYYADGHAAVVITKVVNETASEPSADTTLVNIQTGIAAPVAGDKFSIWATGSAPVTITCFINDVQVATASDNTAVLTGTFGGLHAYENQSTSEARITSMAVFAKAAPPPPPPPPGNRPVQDWPWASNTPWNTPIGDGATPVGNPAGTAGYITSMHVDNWTNGFGLSFHGGNPPDVDITQSTANQFAEGHDAFCGQAIGHVGDRNWIQDWYQYGHPTAAAREQIAIDLRGQGYPTVNMAWTGNSGAWGHVNVAGFSNYVGVIRTYDLRVQAPTLGYIPHCLGGTLNRSFLQSAAHGAGFIWPADHQDGGWNTAGGPAEYLGYVPIGGALYIPWTATKPSLTALGSVIWETLRRFPFYVKDSSQSSNSQLHCEANVQNFVYAPSGQKFSTWANGGELTTIFQHVVLMSNNTAGSINGPGNRRAPLAPAV